MDNGEALSKMLRKSAYTDLRSNIIVETDGVTAREIDGFPDNPTTICIERCALPYLSQALSVSLLQEHPSSHLPQFLSHTLRHHFKYPAQESNLSRKGTGLKNPQKAFNAIGFHSNPNFRKCLINNQR